jgi:hypothetical protein
MASDTPHPTPIGREDFILATYREIALHFGLGGPNAARTKVKRAGWHAEPTNHPADPLRIRVPRDAWYQAGEALPHTRHEMGHPKPTRDAPSQKLQKRDTRHIKALEMAVAALREGLAAAEARADQAQARAGRAEAHADAADADRRAADARANRAEQDREALRAELAKTEDKLREIEAKRVQFWSRGRFARALAAWKGR